MNKLPIITRLAEIDIRVVYGQRIFELHQQLQKILTREFPEYENLLAEPAVNATRGEISWSARVGGKVVSGGDLTDEQWGGVARYLVDVNAKIQGFITRLEAMGRGNSIEVESFRSLLITPDLRGSVFIVGTDIVLTQWGCYKFGTNVTDAHLLRQVDRVRSDSAPNIHQDPKESSPKPLEHNRFNGGGGAPTGEQPIPGAGTNYNPKDDVGPKTPIEEQTAPIVPPLQVAAVDSIRPTAWKWLVILFLLILLLIGLIYRFIAGGQNPAERELRNEILALSTKIQEKLAECGAGSDSAGGQPSAGDAALSQDEMKRRQVDNNVGSSGRVNVALAWGSKVDLDLVVMQPDGSFVYFGRCDGKLCGSLDVDANFCSSGASCPGLTDKPLENISWNERMQPGIYTVLVNLYSTHSTMKPRAPIPYTIELRVGGEIKTFAGRIAPESVSCSDRCSAKLIQVTQFKID